MAENFFLDNPDLQYRFDRLDLAEVVAIKEKDYTYHKQFPTAPRSYPDALDNYRLMLEVLGEIAANVVAPRAAEADEEGAQFHDGQVTYAAATQAGIEALKQAELMGAMLPWDYGGLNLPESIYQIMVEIISRAEAGLMTIFGLQEIAASINEFCDEPTKARILPRFGRGEVAGAMVLTEPDAGSDLGAVRTTAHFDEATGKWYLNGVKRFITNGCADVQLVLARTEEGSTDARGLSLFLVEKDESVRIRRIENKMGLHASPTCEIQYNNTPAELVGKRRFGLLRYTMGADEWGAPGSGGPGHRHRRGGLPRSRPLRRRTPAVRQADRELPAVARMLLSMRGEIEAARALVFETGKWVDRLKGLRASAGRKPNPTRPCARSRNRPPAWRKH